MVQPSRTEVQAGVLFFAALCLLVLPLRWIIAILLSGTIHELSHILAIKLQKLKIHHMKIGPSGAVISVQPMKPLQELICAAAGPIASFSLLFTATVFSELALCGFFQGLYNLLPLYPSDGGRILRSFLELCNFQTIDAVEEWAKGITYLALLSSAAILIFLFRRWWLFILGALLLILRPAHGKTPCNASRFALQ